MSSTFQEAEENQIRMTTRRAVEMKVFWKAQLLFRYYQTCYFWSNL